MREVTLSGNREHGVRASFGCVVDVHSCVLSGNQCEAALSEGADTQLNTWGCKMEGTVRERRLLSHMLTAAWCAGWA